MGDWMNKLLYSHTMECYEAIKRNEEYLLIMAVWSLGYINWKKKMYQYATIYLRNGEYKHGRV